MTRAEQAAVEGEAGAVVVEAVRGQLCAGVVGIGRHGGHAVRRQDAVGRLVELVGKGCIIFQRGEVMKDFGFRQALRTVWQEREGAFFEVKQRAEAQRRVAFTRAPMQVEPRKFIAEQCLVGFAPAADAPGAAGGADGGVDGGEAGRVGQVRLDQGQLVERPCPGFGVGGKARAGHVGAGPEGGEAQAVGAVEAPRGAQGGVGVEPGHEVGGGADVSDGGRVAGERADGVGGADEQVGVGLGAVRRFRRAGGRAGGRCGCLCRSSCQPFRGGGRCVRVGVRCGRSEEEGCGRKAEYGA